MELKKNPKVDLTRKRGLFFNMSLAIVLFIVNTAFEWRTSNPELIDLSGKYSDESKIELFDQEEAPLQIPRPQPSQQKNQILEKSEEMLEDDGEIMIKVQLDVAIEGGEFDNSFLDQLAQKS